MNKDSLEDAKKKNAERKYMIKIVSTYVSTIFKGISILKQNSNLLWFYIKATKIVDEEFCTTGSRKM